MKRAWVLAYLREPTEKELTGAFAFLRTASETFHKQSQPAVPPKEGRGRLRRRPPPKLGAGRVLPGGS